MEYIRTIESLQAQVDHLTRAHDDMAERLRGVQTDYKDVLNEIINFQRNLGQHDMLVQNLIQHFLQADQTINASRITQPSLHDQNTSSISPFIENSNTANPFFSEQCGATLSVDDFMTDVSGGPLDIDVSKDSSSFNLQMMGPPSRPDSVLTRLMTSGMFPTPPAEGFRESSIFSTPGDAVPQKPELTPVWSTTPRVFIVEDDQVSRDLCTKYLQDCGCSVESASDGASAVNEMNIEKFDLVLMASIFPPAMAHPFPDCPRQGITIPKLDGCSATSMVRQFNRNTPIVAFTSNIKPSHVMTYFTAGMTDVLGKPFSKAEVSEILDVCYNSTFPFFSLDPDRMSR